MPKIKVKGQTKKFPYTPEGRMKADKEIMEARKRGLKIKVIPKGNA